MFILESLRHYFLRGVTVYLAQLVLNAEPYPFFCLWTLMPVTRRPAWGVACSRWRTSRSYLFVCLEREKKILLALPFLFFLPSWEQSAQSLENWWQPSLPLSYIASCFYASAFSTYYSFSMAWKIRGLSDDCFPEPVQHVKRWLSLIVQLRGV